LVSIADKLATDAVLKSLEAMYKPLIKHSVDAHQAILASILKFLPLRELPNQGTPTGALDGYILASELAIARVCRRNFSLSNARPVRLYVLIKTFIATGEFPHVMRIIMPPRVEISMQTAAVLCSDGS
jgi:hypothetical protein